MTSLADDEALERVYLGKDGVVEGIRPGTVAVDTSTVDPRTIDRVGDSTSTRPVPGSWTVPCRAA